MNLSRRPTEGWQFAGRGSKSGPSGSRHTNPFARGSDEFGFADFFNNAQNEGYSIYRQLESEREAILNEKSAFARRPPARATYAALMGGGFGDLNFYERFPQSESAFLEFMRAHLDDLFDPKAEWQLSQVEVEKLAGAVERSGNPSDLATAVWSWKKSKGWEAGPNPCPFGELAAGPKKGLAGPKSAEKPTPSNRRRRTQ